MTTEELIAAGLPVDPVVEGDEHVAPAEDTGSPSGSRSHKDGEVQSDDGEDIGDVEPALVTWLERRPPARCHPHLSSENPR
jgi:hypothetical protein